MDIELPSDLRYTAESEWVRVDGDQATVGVTDYAQDQLGDVVFVELPEVGRALQRGEVFGAIESVKAVSDLETPLGGEVIAVNGALDATPELVNESPYGDGWMLRLRIRDRAELDHLLSDQAYRELLPDEP